MLKGQRAVCLAKVHEASCTISIFQADVHKWRPSCNPKGYSVIYRSLSFVEVVVFAVWWGSTSFRWDREVVRVMMQGNERLTGRSEAVDSLKRTGRKKGTPSGILDYMTIFLKFLKYDMPPLFRFNNTFCLPFWLWGKDAGHLHMRRLYPAKRRQLRGLRIAQAAIAGLSTQSNRDLPEQRRGVWPKEQKGRTSQDTSSNMFFWMTRTWSTKVHCISGMSTYSRGQELCKCCTCGYSQPLAKDIRTWLDEESNWEDYMKRCARPLVCELHGLLYIM